MPVKRKILILSASVGAGHVRAAEAVKEAILSLEPQSEVVAVDFLRYFNWYFGRMVEEAYYAATKHVPRVYKLLYDLHDNPSAMRLKKLQGRLGLAKLCQLIEEKKPEAIISTHFFPAGVASQLKESGKLVRAVVLTDYVSHPLWLYPGVDAYFVAHEGMKEALVASGIEPERVYATGIPIGRAFAASYDGEVLKKKYQLRTDLPVVLVTSGGHGIGPFTQIIRALGRVQADFQVVVVAGQNPTLEWKLHRLSRTYPLPMRVLGFVDNMYEWMAMAEVLVSKAGGLTVSEAMAMGLPMVVVRPTPGQETGNTDYLLAHGAAYYIRHLNELPKTLEKFLKDPQERQRMRAAARSIAKPHAAHEVARTVLELCEARERDRHRSGDHDHQ